MESNPKKTFEDHWAEAFKDASMVPPDQCWENIERELDKKEDRKPFLLLWRNKGLATGIAAMLLLTFGYVLYKNNTVKPTVNHPAVASQANRSESAAAEEKITSPDNTTVVIAETGNNTEPKNPELKNSEKTNNHTEAPQLALRKTGNRPPSVSQVDEVSSSDTEKTSFIQPKETTATLADVQTRKTDFGDIHSVDGLEFQPFGSKFILKRNKLSYDLPANTEVLASNDSKGFWMGLNSGVSPFNPNYSGSNFGQDAVMSANKISNADFNYAPSMANGSPAASVGFNKPSSQPDNNIRKGRAVNVGISMGKKLSKRLGLESGFRYLKANSGLQTNVYSVNEQTGDIQAYFQANYLNSSANRANTIISLSENGNQAYDYLSVPMQLSYQIPLLKKLGLQVLGGVSGDLFLKSVLTGTNSGKNTLTASNSTYKPLNISGLGGLRLNYAVGKNWEAVLGSFYQHSLNSGVRSDQNLSFRPRMFGMNYGLNYKF